MSENKKRQPRQGAVWRAHDATLVEWNSMESRVTRPWPKPRAWRKPAAEGSAWVECFGSVPSHITSPEWTSVSQRKDTPSTLAVRQAWSTVPADVREAIHSAALQGEEWGMLSMLARCPGALELARSVPVLAGALAASRRFGAPVARPLRSVRALLRRPDGMVRWRAIARWLELPHCRAFINALRKMTTTASVSVQDIKSLQLLWNHRLAQKRILHSEALSLDALYLIKAAHEHGVLDQLHPDLVGAAGHGGRWGGLAFRFDIAVQMWQYLHPRRPLPAWRTLEQVEVASTALRDEVRQAKGLTTLAVYPFPPPPFEGGPGITPLISEAELVAEGAAMGHCLGWQNWQQEARMCRGYAFHVGEGPDRATLWLRRDRSCALGFQIDQFKGPGNAAPTPTAIDMVARWITNLGAAPTLPEAWISPKAIASGDPTPFWLDDDDIPF